MTCATARATAIRLGLVFQGYGEVKHLRARLPALGHRKGTQMILTQIRSLALTPDLTDVENLPIPQIYILHDTLTWIERYWRNEQGVPYPPSNPEPYEIPPDIEQSLDDSIKFLPPHEWRPCINSFLQNLKRFTPTKENLLIRLVEALRPAKYIHLFPDRSINTNPPPLCQKPCPQDAPGQDIRKQPIVKPAPKKVTRGLQWRLDPIWEKLTRCAKAVFMVLCLRAIWPKKLTSFPWAFGGVGTWTKEQGVKPGSLCRLTGYAQRQVRYSLCQLQGYGMIKKINRGFEGHGVSKFYVFFTPAMSKAFTAIAKNKKRIPNQKKRSSRMN